MGATIYISDIGIGLRYGRGVMGGGMLVLNQQAALVLNQAGASPGLAA